MATKITSATPSPSRSPTAGVETRSAVVQAHSSRSEKGGPGGRTWHAPPGPGDVVGLVGLTTARPASTKARSGLPRNGSDPETDASTARVSSGARPPSVTRPSTASAAPSVPSPSRSSKKATSNGPPTGTVDWLRTRALAIPVAASARASVASPGGVDVHHDEVGLCRDRRQGLPPRGGCSARRTRRSVRGARRRRPPTRRRPPASSSFAAGRSVTSSYSPGWR